MPGSTPKTTMARFTSGFGSASRHFITRTATVLASTLLASMFLGCASRGPRPQVAVVSPATNVEASKARELTTIWRDDLTAYLKRGGEDWPTRLSRLRDVQTRRGLRPGRIYFSTLAAGGDPDSADSWDVSGLLLGRQMVGGRDWYLFIVGVVQRESFRPIEVRDLRLMAFATGGSDPLWRQGEANPESLNRYWETFRQNIPVRFPADDDGYRVEVVGNRVTVRELRSGAEWTLLLTDDR